MNSRLAELDIDARIDHRSLQRGDRARTWDKIGSAASRMEAHGLEAERIAEHRDIAHATASASSADGPRIALDAITHSQATFTNRDLAMFAHRHSEGREQYDAVLGAVRASPGLIALGQDGRGEDPVHQPRHDRDRTAAEPSR